MKNEESVIDYSNLQNFIFEQKSTDEHSIHGLDHWNQVEYNGLLLATKTKANVEVVRLFALFHDSRRESDRQDFGHGARGAELAKACRGKLFELDDARFELLYNACAWHTEKWRTGDPTIDTCFDADRLDLGRAGIYPAANKMATAYWAELARQAALKSIPVFKMRQWIQSLKTK